MFFGSARRAYERSLRYRGFAARMLTLATMACSTLRPSELGPTVSAASILYRDAVPACPEEVACEPPPRVRVSSGVRPAVLEQKVS